MAYDYEKAKKAYEGLTDEQKQQFADRYGSDSTVQQFARDYTADRFGGGQTGYNHHIEYDENNNPISVTSTNLSSGASTTKSVNRTTSSLAASNPYYRNQGNGNYSYNPVSGYYEKVVNRNNKGNSLNMDEDSDYYGILDNKSKTSPDATYQRGTDQKTDPLLNNQTLNNQNVADAKVDLTGNVNENMNKWGDFNAAVNNKLQTAFGMQDLNELKQKYPEQYSSLVQALDSVAGTWNALDPSQRGMLEGQLQAIIGTAVGAGSDMSKLNVRESSIMSKFKDPDRVKTDAQNVLRLQTEGLTTGEIAKQMGMSEDQVQQLVLLANGLDSKAGEYYELTDKAAKDITEDYDTQIERLEKQKEIQLERANRQIEWMKEDFDTQIDRQKQANDIAAHNADFLSGMYGYGFSKRGIEGLNYVQEQAQQIIDDMVKNYDRNNQEMVDGVTDILRNWEWNNEDLLKASEDALTQAKNNYTSNMLAIQQQYGTVGMQAQQQLAQNVQNFITEAETIYDNALKRQQNNLTNLITNFSNLNALQYSNLTLRNAQIQQFQNESMNLNRNQLQGLAQQLGMDSASFQDLVNYQVQAVANQLNGYIPGSGLQFQSQIQSLLDQGYTPNQAMQSVMNSQEWKAATTDTGEWKISGNYMYNNVTGDVQQLGGDYAMSNGYLYDKSTGDWIDLNSDEWVKINDNTVMNKRDGTTRTLNGTDNYVSYETINGQTYGVSRKTYNTLANFMNQYSIGDTGGQCGTFVKKYLSSMGITRPNISKLADKEAQINTPKGYSPQIGDVVIMDSPYAETKANGHIAIVTGVDGDKITTLESNRKNNDQKVFSRTIDTSKTKVHGYYHPDGAGTITNGSNYEGGYDPDLEFVFENMAKENGKLDSTTQKNLLDKGYSLEDIGKQYNNYKSRKGVGEEDNNYELPEGFTVTNQKLFDQTTNKEDITSTIEHYNSLMSSAEKLKELVLEYGTEVLPTQTRTMMNQYVKDIQLQAKELYNLGVLNGPDLELMEAIIYNPTKKSAKIESWINGRSKQDIRNLIENGVNTVNDKAKNKLKNYGVSIDGSTGTHSSANNKLVGDMKISSNLMNGGGRIGAGSSVG